MLLARGFAGALRQTAPQALASACFVSLAALLIAGAGPGFGAGLDGIAVVLEADGFGDDLLWLCCLALE
ncbi:MAG: hypothetical protein AB1430_08935 [Pseudomonadota bacterium]